MASPDDPSQPITPPAQRPLIDHLAGPKGLAPRLTETGHTVVPVPDRVYRRLQTIFEPVWTGDPGAWKPEHDTAAGFIRACLVDADWNRDDPSTCLGAPCLVLREDDHRLQRLLYDLQPRVEDWTGHRLRPTEVYGPRVYRRNAMLLRHVDHPTTHIVSASVTIAAAIDEPWPLCVDTDSGTVTIALEPGQMLLYEGSRLPHYRPTPLRGDFYANVYFHYCPVDARFDAERGSWVLNEPARQANAERPKGV